MKKIFFMLMTSALLVLSGCTKDEIIYQNTYVNGDYVFVDYVTIKGNDFQSEIELNPNDQTYKTSCLYYDHVWKYSNNNDVIDQTMMEKSFVVAYWLQNDCDIPLPVTFKYDEGGVEKTAVVRYNVAQGSIRFIIESVDGKNENLQQVIKNDEFSFKMGCMIYNGD